MVSADEMLESGSVCGVVTWENVLYGAELGGCPCGHGQSCGWCPGFLSVLVNSCVTALVHWRKAPAALVTSR